MENYRNSILKYESDVHNMIEYAREEEKVSFLHKCLQKNMPMEDIIFLTGFSKEQIIHFTVK
jgi:hypothetical protein